jgi:hypothetical protein
MKFLGRLNSLNWKLSWRTLGEAVRRSYAVQLRNGAIRAKMFGEQLIIENRETAPIQFCRFKGRSRFRGRKMRYG